MRKIVSVFLFFSFSLIQVHELVHFHDDGRGLWRHHWQGNLSPSRAEAVVQDAEKNADQGTEKKAGNNTAACALCAYRAHLKGLTLQRPNFAFLKRQVVDLVLNEADDGAGWLSLDGEPRQARAPPKIPRHATPRSSTSIGCGGYSGGGVDGSRSFVITMNGRYAAIPHKQRHLINR